MIEEFRVVVAAVDVEGRGSAQVQARTKSGTNQFHGAGVWNIRNSAMNANSWGNNRQGITPIWYNRHQFTASLGGPVIKSGDPIEQEKQLKYASLVANAVMLSNVADMTTALSAMDGDGHPVTPALVSCLSPYTREHIRRFGQYVLDMADLPPPLDPQPLPFEKA